MIIRWLRNGVTRVLAGIRLLTPVTPSIVYATYFPDCIGPSLEFETIEGPSLEFATLEGPSLEFETLEGPAD